MLLGDLVSSRWCNQFLEPHLGIPSLDHERRVHFHYVELQVVFCEQIWEQGFEVFGSIGDAGVASNIGDFLQAWVQHEWHIFARECWSQTQGCRLDRAAQW